MRRQRMHAAVEPFTVAPDQIRDARGEFQDRSQPPQNLAELIEFLIDPGDERGRVFLIAARAAAVSLDGGPVAN